MFSGFPFFIEPVSPTVGDFRPVAETAGTPGGFRGTGLRLTSGPRILTLYLMNTRCLRAGISRLRRSCLIPTSLSVRPHRNPGKLDLLLLTSDHDSLPMFQRCSLTSVLLGCFTT